MKTIIPLFLLFSILLFSSCSSSEQTRKDTDESPQIKRIRPNTFVFECDSVNSFTVRYDGNKAYLYLPDSTITLEQAISASGARYINGKYTVWTKGESAYIETGGKTFSNCPANYTKSVWADAQLRGISLRASGFEPEWQLEIQEEKTITFDINFSEEQYVFPAPKVETNNAYGTVIYQSATGKNKIKVTVENKKCEDTMSGETMDKQVTVILDGRTYYGCGRELFQK